MRDAGLRGRRSQRCARAGRARRDRSCTVQRSAAASDVPGMPMHSLGRDVRAGHPAWPSHAPGELRPRAHNPPYPCGPRLALPWRSCPTASPHLPPFFRAKRRSASRLRGFVGHERAAISSLAAASRRGEGPTALRDEPLVPPQRQQPLRPDRYVRPARGRPTLLRQVLAGLGRSCRPGCGIGAQAVITIPHRAQLACGQRRG